MPANFTPLQTLLSAVACLLPFATLLKRDRDVIAPSVPIGLIFDWTIHGHAWRRGASVVRKRRGGRRRCNVCGVVGCGVSSVESWLFDLSASSPLRILPSNAINTSFAEIKVYISSSNSTI